VPGANDPTVEGTSNGTTVVTTDGKTKTTNITFGETQFLGEVDSNGLTPVAAYKGWDGIMTTYQTRFPSFPSDHIPNSNDQYRAIVEDFGRYGLDGAPMAMVRGGGVIAGGVTVGVVATPMVVWFGGLSTPVKVIILGAVLRASSGQDIKGVPPNRFGGGFGTQLRPPIAQTVGRVLKKSPRGPGPDPLP